MAFKGIDYPRWVLTLGISIVLLWLSGFDDHSGIRAPHLRDQSRTVANRGRREPGRIIKIVSPPGQAWAILSSDFWRRLTLIPPGDMPVLGPVSSLPQVSRVSIDEVMFASPTITHKQVLHLVHSCGKLKINVKVFPDVFQIMSSEAGVPS